MAAIDMAAWDVLASPLRCRSPDFSAGEEKTGSGLPQPRHGMAGPDGAARERASVREV